MTLPQMNRISLKSEDHGVLLVEPVVIEYFFMQNDEKKG